MGYQSGSCSVCRHEQRAAIDQALASKVAIRTVVAQFPGLNRPTLARHKLRHVEMKARPRATNDAAEDEETAAIDAEIKRLRKAQKRAGRQDLKLAIGKELRTWMELKAKLRAKRPVDGGRDLQEPASRVEALELAKAILEMEVASNQREVVAWLEQLLERATATTATAASVFENRSPQ
jgi:hypothetical protein